MKKLFGAGDPTSGAVVGAADVVAGEVVVVQVGLDRRSGEQVLAGVALAVARDVDA
jgi:hypothetical protein